MRFEITIAQSDADLEGILDLQRQNLPAVLPVETLQQEGFVTVQHNLPLLRRMNTAKPHTIARQVDDGRVVGYALVMLGTFRNEIPVLVPMFEMIDSCQYQGSFLKEIPYVVMGQICIERSFRGKGLFDALYRGMRDRLRGEFSLIITEVATRNQRSLRAHMRVGFKTALTYTAPDQETWELLALEI